MNTTQELQSCSPTSVRESSGAALRVRPALDLIESADDFLMSLEMPGVDPSSVEVSLERNVLTVTGTAEDRSPEGFRLVAGEAGQRIYERSFQLSEDIDRDDIDAEVKNGVLTLKFPKSHRAKKAKIDVRGV